MIDFLKALNKLFQEVTPESYLEINNKKAVSYPYLTYSLDREYVSRETDGFYIDVDVFDKSSSYMRIFELEEKLTKQFGHLAQLTDNLYIRSYVPRSVSVPTLSDELKRRNIQIYCKTDWRKK